jgi:uncharacterized protein YyaL (SSP411 family)
MGNRLAAETSPYLRQHADNPVDWWPWSEAALATARAQDKPILLSIGYSACHWCHVMAHESFEDEATAQVMNSLFVNIKVDREERPDLDKIYQLSHQALTQRGGGWPLTVFLAPDDLVPFYAGTYFPKDARYGMPPFAYVLEQVRGFWDRRRGDVRAQTAALGEFLRDYDGGAGHDASAALDAAPLAAALALSARSFDRDHGGHRGAPKFPHCPEMELLLDVADTLPARAAASAHIDAASARAMVDTTLDRMAAGGIHDQIGGGFCRYSVDERWEIPHFEKMLYDNAQLLPLYAQLSRATDGRAFGQVCHALLGWLEREMTAPDGGFHTALDADSEHEEGKFYVWRRDDVRALLDDSEYAVAAQYFGFDRPANFEGHAWNPIVATPLSTAASNLGVAADDAARTLAAAKRKLFDARATRVRPGLDDKVLTANNALMIAGLARAARLLDSARVFALAERALDALHRGAWRDGRLLAKCGADAERFPGFLDDHAFLLDALLECLQQRWQTRDLRWAIALADALLERFEDRERGGFYFTAHDHEALPQRPKPWTDEAVPSGNGVAARALQRLGHLLGETRYTDAAERTLRAAWPTLQQMPHACATLLRALNDQLQPRTHVVVRHDETAAQPWRAALADGVDARVDAYFISGDAGELPGLLASQKLVGRGVAYVCRGTRCLAPSLDQAQLRHALSLAQD